MVFPLLSITQRKQIAKKRERNPDGTFASKAKVTVNKLRNFYSEVKDRHNSQKEYNTQMSEAVDIYNWAGESGKRANYGRLSKIAKNGARADQIADLEWGFSVYNDAQKIASDFAERSKVRGFNNTLKVDKRLNGKDHSWNRKYHAQSVEWMKSHGKSKIAKRQSAFLAELKKK